MEIDEAKEKITLLIKDISILHTTTCEKWAKYAKDKEISLFNQKSKRISELITEETFDVVFNYVDFLNELNEIKEIGQDYSENFVIDSRVKASNSILEKCNDYCEFADHKGKVPVNKCLNDLFGVRAIIDCPELVLSDVEDCVKNIDGIKLVDKSFDENFSTTKYLAAHVYFLGKGNSEDKNKVFRWELQIWKKHQESNNQNLHKKHRFRYTHWESTVKKQ